jgi:hypothetical protein
VSLNSHVSVSVPKYSFPRRSARSLSCPDTKAGNTVKVVHKKTPRLEYMLAWLNGSEPLHFRNHMPVPSHALKWSHGRFSVTVTYRETGMVHGDQALEYELDFFYLARIAIAYLGTWKKWLPQLVQFDAPCSRRIFPASTRVFPSHSVSPNRAAGSSKLGIFLPRAPPRLIARDENVPGIQSSSSHRWPPAFDGPTYPSGRCYLFNELSLALRTAKVVCGYRQY